MGFDLNKWISQKMQGEVVLEYSGDITSERIAESLNEIETNLNLKNEKNQIRKKV